MSDSVKEHRDQASESGEDDGPLGIAWVTVSDTRDKQTDTGAQDAKALIEGAGHAVTFYRIVPDEPYEIEAALIETSSALKVDVICFSGGTGLAPRDRTPDTIKPHIEREIPGFGEIFRMLSWEEVGPAALLSLAFAGLERYSGKPVFCLPGSRNAVKLALEKIILPDLRHLLYETKRSPERRKLV